MAERQAIAEWKSHWLLAAAATLGFTFSPVVTYSLGLFMEPLEREFGWTRAQISSGLIVYSLLSVPFSAPVGALIDRFGARRIAIPGILLTIVAVASLSLASGSMTQWLGLWVLYGIATLFVKSTVWTAAVSKAFFSSRGLALGVVLCGSGISQTLTPIVAQPLIDNYGWRMAYQLIAAGWGGLVLVLLLLFFHDVKGAQATAQPLAKPGAGAAATLPGYTFREAMRTRAILQICGAVTLNSLLTVGVSVHLVPILSETGLSRTEAAALASLGGLSAIVGKLATGSLLDRFRGNLIPFTSFAMPAVGMSILLAGVDTMAMAGLAVLALGYAAGASTQSSAYLVTRYAGLRSFGAVFGILSSMIGLALGVGPWLAGRIFDTTGSYELLLTMGIPVTIMAGVLVIGLGAYPRFEQAPAAA